MQDIDLDLTQAEACDLFRNTIGQAGCSLWFEARKTCLTASNFGASMKSKKYNENFVRNYLLNPKDLSNYQLCCMGRKMRMWL
ncbi:hypothetical protein DPMN_114285 [Dreissena polymorpha]|uniref:Uncharacterized protein n=1 Tax=Dreissena polymorpha TaxID=45954 RepID=A0A9D4KJV9_DREPO|nr:hypothetical protein DPMN_114285 [Dreissena polymorpha]